MKKDYIKYFLLLIILFGTICILGAYWGGFHIELYSSLNETRGFSLIKAHLNFLTNIWLYIGIFSLIFVLFGFIFINRYDFTIDSTIVTVINGISFVIALSLSYVYAYFYLLYFSGVTGVSIFDFGPEYDFDMFMAYTLANPYYITCVINAIFAAGCKIFPFSKRFFNPAKLAEQRRREILGY